MTITVEIQKPCGNFRTLSLTAETLPVLHTIVPVKTVLSEVQSLIEQGKDPWTSAKVYDSGSGALLGALKSE